MKNINVILISIDTLRRDHLSCYGYNRKTTPNIDNLANDSCFFTNAYSTAVWTPPAHATMFTGLFPSQHGVMDQNRLPKDIKTLAETLQQAGYHTAGFANNSQVGALVGLDRGYADFYEVWRGISRWDLYHRSTHKVKELAGNSDKGAYQTNKLVVRWLKKRWHRNQPFFLFIHFLEPHNPLKPPLKYYNRSRNSNGQNNEIDKNRLADYSQNPLVHYLTKQALDENTRRQLIDLYDAEINYLDAKINELLNYFKKMGLFDRTLFILTADHGEHFGEHGLYSHVASLYEPIVHIPFIVRFPDDKFRGQTIDSPVQLVDIFPTILDASGINNVSNEDLPGKSLLPVVRGDNSLKDRSLFAEWEGRVPIFIQKRADISLDNEHINKLKQKKRMIRKGKYKYILTIDGNEELYNIFSDPQEQIDLAETEVNTKKELKTELLEWQETTDIHTHAVSYDADEKVLKNLRALGYM